MAEAPTVAKTEDAAAAPPAQQQDESSKMVLLPLNSKELWGDGTMHGFTLGSRLPADATVRLSRENTTLPKEGDGYDLFPAFSSFISTTPDTTPCAWTPNGQGVAMDDLTLAIYSSCTVLAEAPTRLLVLLNPAKKYYSCTDCKAKLTNPLFCAGCLLATYCNDSCAKKNWATGHKAVCKCVSPAVDHMVALQDWKPEVVKAKITEHGEK